MIDDIIFLEIGATCEFEERSDGTDRSSTSETTVGSSIDSLRSSMYVIVKRKQEYWKNYSKIFSCDHKLFIPRYCFACLGIPVQSNEYSFPIFLVILK